MKLRIGDDADRQEPSRETFSRARRKSALHIFGRQTECLPHPYQAINLLVELESGADHAFGHTSSFVGRFKRHAHRFSVARETRVRLSFLAVYPQTMGNWRPAGRINSLSGVGVR